MQTTNEQRWQYAVMNFGMLLPGQLFGGSLVFFYTDVLKASPAAIGQALAIFAIWNAINNPIVGWLSDRTRTRWGRRIPYILFGLVPAYLLTAIYWNPQWLGVQNPALLPLFLLIVLSITDVISTGIGQAYYSLLPEMFPLYKERTDVAVKMNIFQVPSLLLGLALPPLLGPRIGYGTLAVIFLVISAVIIFAGLRGLFERYDKDVSAGLPLFAALKATFFNRSFLTVVLAQMMRFVTTNTLTLGMIFYVKYSLGLDEGLTTLMLALAFIVAGVALKPWRELVANRFEARTTLMLAYAAMAVAVVPLFFISSLIAAVVTAVLIGIALAGLILMGDIILGDVIDEDETKTGLRREGMYFGMNSLILTLSSAISSMAFAIIVPAYGYDPTLVVQPATVAEGFRVFMTVVPILAALFAILMLNLYPLYGRRLQAVKDALAAKHNSHAT